MRKTVLFLCLLNVLLLVASGTFPAYGESFPTEETWKAQAVRAKVLSVETKPVSTVGREADQLVGSVKFIV